MALINFAHREITTKVVYFGAPGAGSNTNVRTLYELLPVKEKSRLHHFGPAADAEESWYFDYVPNDEPVQGFALRFRVYSMPGGIQNRTHREEVLRGTDSVVFVADAREARGQANIDALLELERLLADQQVELASLPIVIQVNHSDAHDARDPGQVVVDLNPYGFPVVPAVARQQRGVLEAHDRLTSETASRIRDNLAGNQTAITLTAIHRETVERDEDVIARHVQAIESSESKRTSGRTSLEMAIGDLQLGLRSRYRALPGGPKVEVAFQPREYVGMKPCYLLESRIDSDGIMVEIVLDRLGGGEPKRLTVALLNRPRDETPPSSPPPQAPRLTTPPAGTMPLPDRVDIPPPPASDFPPVWYGVAGIAGGILVGVLIGYIVFG